MQIEISEVKAVKYRKKDCYRDMDFSERGRKSMYFGFDDIEQNSKGFISNVSQDEERQNDTYSHMLIPEINV